MDEVWIVRGEGGGIVVGRGVLLLWRGGFLGFEGEILGWWWGLVCLRVRWGGCGDYVQQGFRGRGRGLGRVQYILTNLWGMVGSW